MKTAIAILLLAIAEASSGAVVTTTEHAVAPVTYGEAIGAQRNAALAVAGSDVLALWSEPGGGVYDTVVTAPGIFTPNPPRHILTGAGCAAVWTGAAYLTLSQRRNDIEVSLLDRDGVVVRGPSVIEWYGLPRSMAWNGRRAMLTYFDGHSIVAAILDANGTVIRDHLVIATNPDAVSNPVVAGSTFGVFVAPVSPAAGIQLLRFTGDGDLLDAQRLPVERSQQASDVPNIAAASDGVHFALAYDDRPSPTEVVLRSAIIDAASLTVQIEPAVSTWVRDLHVVWNGRNFVAAFDSGTPNETRVYALPFGNDTPALVYTSSGGNASIDAVASNGTATYVALTIYAPGADVIVVPIDASGTAAGDPFTISTGAQAQVTSAIAPGLVVWTDSRRDGGNGELFASRIDGIGAPIGAPVQLSTSGSVSATARPQVVFTGTIWFVVWNEDNLGMAPFRVMARRIAADGTLLDAAPFQISDSSSAALAFNGLRIVVLYPTAAGTVAARFDQQGEAIDTVTVFPGNTHPMMLASNGDGFLAVWGVPTSPAQLMVNVECARLDALGQPLDAQPTAIGSGTAPAAVGSNGRDYLVAWVAAVPAKGSWETQAQARRVDADGTLGPVSVVGTVSEGAAALAGDRNGYWFTSYILKTGVIDAAAARLDADGTVLDRGIVAVDAWPASPVSVMSAGDGALISYVRNVPDVGAPRVFTSRVVARSRPHAVSR